MFDRVFIVCLCRFFFIAHLCECFYCVFVYCVFIVFVVFNVFYCVFLLCQPSVQRSDMISLKPRLHNFGLQHHQWLTHTWNHFQTEVTRLHPTFTQVVWSCDL